MDSISKKHHGDKGASKLNSWDQLLCMIFWHLGHCMSRRDITNRILSTGGNLNHPGISSTPSRNALSHQNEERRCVIGKDLYMALQQHLGQHGHLFCRSAQKDVKYRRLAEFGQPDDREQDILIDEAAEFVGELTSRRYHHPIRRVTVYDHETMEELIARHDGRSESF